MEFNLETIVFYFLAAFITVFSILTVTTRRMVRSATYLLFVLFGTAGIYFLLVNVPPSSSNCHEKQSYHPLSIPGKRDMKTKSDKIPVL